MGIRFVVSSEWPPQFSRLLQARDSEDLFLTWILEKKKNPSTIQIYLLLFQNTSLHWAEICNHLNEYGHVLRTLTY